MPTVTVNRELLFKTLTKSFTDDEFRDLCFAYGIELDDVTSMKEMLMRDTGVVDNNVSDDVVYKIDVPANRYDLLCLEGLARSLRIFLGIEPMSQFTVTKPQQMQTMIVKHETNQIRPFVVCAILRNITFDSHSYNSFLDLQDKLHHNICRKRTLVAIGTHDLDTISGPFEYHAKNPETITFHPLMEEKEFRADQLLHYYEFEKVNSKLKPFCKIINKSPVYPVIYDANGVVLSLPPIINGNHSKISINTKNVFIECTATDMTKAQIVLNMMITMFSPYCKEAFNVEGVNVVYENPEFSKYNGVTPDLTPRTVTANADYVNRGIGINIPVTKMAELLTRMSLPAEANVDKNELTVFIPPTRPDILHACDVMEDVAVAYGFNNLKPCIPPTPSEGRQQPINKLSDLMRENLAQAGYTEALTWALCSIEENFTHLRKPDDGTLAVKVSNPKTAEFQLVRTNLVGGLLKTLSANQAFLNLPIRLFEVSDISLLDASTDIGARNERRLAALYCGSTSGFEEIHGILDRVMELNRARFAHEDKSIRDKARKSDKKDERPVYDIVASSDDTFFPGRRADITLNGTKIGTFGVIHPEVLLNFGIPNPCSAVELNVEALLALHFLPQ